MLTDTIHQGLITHTGRIITSLSPYVYLTIPRSLHVYHNELGQCGFPWRARSVRDDATVSYTHLPTFAYRTLLVEVLFNVRFPIVCTCGGIESQFAGRDSPRLWYNGEPQRPLVLDFLFDWLLLRYSFLATRIWRCQFPLTVTFLALNLIKFTVSDRKVWLIVIVVRAYVWAVDCG